MTRDKLLPLFIKTGLVLLFDLFTGIFIPAFFGWVYYQLYVHTIEVPLSESNTLMTILIVFGIMGLLGFGAFMQAVYHDVLKQWVKLIEIYRR